jgi:hypothetical protein
MDGWTLPGIVVARPPRFPPDSLALLHAGINEFVTSPETRLKGEGRGLRNQ